MHRQQFLAAKYTEKKNVVSKQKMKPTFRLFLSICMFLPVDQVRLYTPVCLDCEVLIK